MKKMFFLISLTTSSLYSQIDKKEAEAFTMNYLRAIVENNCDVYYSSLSNKLFVLNKTETLDRPSKELACDGLPRAIRNKTKTFENFLNDYKIIIILPDELENIYSQPLKNYVKNKNDLLVLAFMPKPGFNFEEDNYLFDDYFRFLIRFENNKWVVKGI